MIVITPPKGIKIAYQDICYASPKHYVVITFWLLFRWRKFNRYTQRIKDGMSWFSAYNDTLKH
jgi:hypothetical protein